MLDIFASLQSFGRSPVLRDCKILTNLNHGFRSGSTINDFLQEYDKEHQLDIAILVFSKACIANSHLQIV
jgi:hypothetical protein